ncbi:MAG: FtsH protease activity modulator HflK [Burkholderiales bacterium]|nr:FtsH protease activity modulator HflK [Burkholderiales bacterium]
MIGALGVLMSLNDPRWGRGGDNNESGPDSQRQPNQRPQDGPPDLDQLWRDFNQKLSALFGGKGGNRGNGTPPTGMPPSGKAAGIGIGIILAVVALIWAASGFFMVPEGHRAVLTTFGKFSGMSDRAGLQWRLPYPIQAHQLVNVAEVTRVEIGFRGSPNTQRPNDVLREALMLTDDENIVDIQFVVSYRVREEMAADFLFNDKDPREAVRQAAESAMREVVASLTMDTILTEGAAAAAQTAAKPAAPVAPAATPDKAAETKAATPAPANVEAEKKAAEVPDTANNQVRRTIQGILDRYKVGISITEVAIVQRRPPEQVQAAFEDVIRAGQDRDRFINEGEAYRNQVVPQAAGTASRLRAEADGYRQRIIQQAEGDAARFRLVLNEYNKAPGVTRDRMYLETMQQIYSNATKVLIDTRQSSPMLYLPLDQLLKQTGAETLNRTPAMSPLPSAAPEASPAPPSEPAAVRDASRARQRDAR